MKLIKMLGLAVVAAVAMTALLGASAASASEVELCKAVEQPCEGANRYELPREITGTLVAGTEAVLTGPGEVRCQTSSVVGEAENTSGKQLIGKITAVSLTKCHTFGGLISCTVEALQLPWKVHLEQATFEGRPEHSDGWMYVGPEPPSTGDQPGIRANCLGIEVTCKVIQEQEGYASEWGKLRVFGGEPARIKAEGLPLKQVGGGNQCYWNATYDLSPSPMYVTHQDS
jgi:hypothetical protein